MKPKLGFYKKTLGERPLRAERVSNCQEQDSCGLSCGVRDEIGLLIWILARDRIGIVNWITPSPISDLSFEDVRTLPDSNVSQKGQQSELLWESEVWGLSESIQQSLE